MNKNYCSRIAEECLSCGKCVKNCVMLKEYVKEPKRFFEEFNNGARGDSIIPYSCLICGFCKAVCPKQLDLGEGFMEIRHTLTMENNGKIPIKALNSVSVHQLLSFSRFFTV